MRSKLCARFAGAVAVCLALLPAAPTESLGRDLLLDLPVASAEPALTARVVSEIPFNRFVRLKCNSNSTSCFGRLPAVPAGERWAVQFVSCQFGTAVDGTLQKFYLLVSDAQVTKQLGFHFLAPTYRAPLPSQEPNPAHNYVVSQPMVLTVAPGNILHLGVTAIGSVFTDACALSGVKQKLG